MPPILQAQSQQNLVKISQDATQEGNQTATTKTSIWPAKLYDKNLVNCDGFIHFMPTKIQIS